MNLYSFNKVSWYEGYDNKGQHFEKWVSATASYDNKTQHFGGELERVWKTFDFVYFNQIRIDAMHMKPR